jgi:hypothetical protein
MTTNNLSNYAHHVTLSTLLRIHLDGMATAATPRRKDLEGRRHNPASHTGSAPAVRGMRFICMALILFMACAGCSRLRAQSTFGTILGTVQDSSGAVIPGATVIAHSLEESADHATTSSTSGEFVFENLKAGHYKVTVVSSAALEARQQLRLPITLSITAAATTVEISADAALMNTENGTINHTISNVEITQLPLNSRSVSSSPLAALAASPEVTRDSQGGIAVGGRAKQTRS